MRTDILIHKNKNLVEGLQHLNKLRNLSRLILFVVDDNEKVVGSVTDGDIRRSIIAEQNLQKTLGEIANPDFKRLYQKDSYQSFEKYRKSDIKILPILNSEEKMVDFIDLEYIKAQLPLEAVIMAGGRGKRLSPLTDTMPKPMLRLGDKPIIEHNIDRLISFGIKKIYISVKYLGEQIVNYLGDGSQKGITIEYVWEDEPLGTAGALALINNLNTEHILLMNSDLFTNVNFESLYLKLINERADMAVASTEYKVDIPYAVFETQEGRVMNFKEKPSFIYHSNAGIYILKRSLIAKIEKGKYCDITDVMEQLVTEGGKLVYDPIIGYWIDIGKTVDYEHAQEFIKHLDH
ncbi:nucleotidyltransferase family protein [Capnocytophaga periodontitidis]|uniref:nucleotidyltransferase family protein n=1 Tax=Capnocytophaga periodontitidis TaxID=2795027 RepID=UPI0018E19AB4|nr:nucleotidyltransferase family protein [Capnocytophaga periodontitidis]MBI1669658.1 nucleotidyltransferase family protein [Capnocytophaga periodontitidis]